MISSRRHGDLILSIKAEVPASAGVYTFYDNSGKIIYIGKSINLRKRLLSYFNHHYDQVEPRLGRMIRQISSYKIETSRDELAALLREDELIKEAQPEYNIRQNRFRHYRYLRFTNDKFPRLEAVGNHGQFSHSRLYGPFPDRFFIDKLVSLISRYLMLRSCSDLEPKDKCLNYGLGHCLGPCRRSLEPSRYEQIVEQVKSFLEGNEDYISGRIEKAMSAAASNRRYEDAAGHQTHLEFCRRFCARQRFVQRFKSEKLILSGGEVSAEVVFIRGDSVGEGGRQTRMKNLSGSIKTNFSLKDDRFVSDRANIVFDWIRNHQCDFMFEDID